MFSSNPLPQVPSSTNVFSPPNSFFDYEKDNVHFNYHQRIDNPSVSGDFVLHAYNCPAPPPVTENVTTFKQDFVIQQPFSEGSELQYCEHHDDLLDSVISSHGSHKKKMATSKKDGHSKIYTARGPRDRRVRLSIDIARKFFCLQDLLGFDKASKTLDWLLTKSLTSIKDLVEETNQCSSSSVTDESKVKFLETIKGDSDEENGQKKKSVLKGVDRKKKKTTRRSKAGSQENLSRDQSRAEARARARERTKEKLRVKRFDEFESGCCGQIEQQNVYKDIGWECIMDGETSNLSKDSSFQIRAFHEQLGDHAVNDLDL